MCESLEFIVTRLLFLKMHRRPYVYRNYMFGLVHAISHKMHSLDSQFLFKLRLFKFIWSSSSERCNRSLCDCINFVVCHFCSTNTSGSDDLPHFQFSMLPIIISLKEFHKKTFLKTMQRKTRKTTTTKKYSIYSELPDQNVSILTNFGGATVNCSMWCSWCYSIYN